MRDGNRGRKRIKRVNIVVICALFLVVMVAVAAYYVITKVNTNPTITTGTVVDNLDSVAVYYNGGTGQTHGRNLSEDGYNLGIKYQCVEFVKRYYYEYYGHKMPDSYGHAKDFYDPALKDGELSVKRNLTQHLNPSKSKPQRGDLVIFDATATNSYGHVAIISDVNDTAVEIIQQNPGPYGKSRVSFGLSQSGGEWRIESGRLLGSLRIAEKQRVKFD